MTIRATKVTMNDTLPLTNYRCNDIMIANKKLSLQRYIKRKYKIKDDDIVLIAGDISWAMNIEGAKEDFRFLDKLNGKKLLCEIVKKQTGSEFVFVIHYKSSGGIGNIFIPCTVQNSRKRKFGQGYFPQRTCFFGKRRFRSGLRCFRHGERKTEGIS